MALPEQVSVDVAIASVLSELEGISLLKPEQRTTLDGKDVFTLLLTDFGKNLIYKWLRWSQSLLI